MKCVSVILGGTAGLGAAIRDTLLERDDYVVVVGRTANEAVQNLPPQYAERVFAEVCDFSSDISSLEGVNNLIERLKKFESSAIHFDRFFWVAGLLRRAPFAEIEPAAIFQMIDVNFRSPAVVAQWVWSHQQKLGGKFVVVSSTAGITDQPRDDEAIYAATKAAQVSFARAIGKQNENQQVNVSLFCPGGMKTPFWNENPIEQDLYGTFMDPKKVAEKIVGDALDQKELYRETIIPRGSV